VKALYIIGVIVLVVLVGAGGFYGGVVYAQSQSQNTTSDFARLRGTDNGSNGGAAGPCGFAGRAFSGNRQGGGQGSGQGSAQGGGQGGTFGNFASMGNCVARGTIKAVSGNTVQISTPVSIVTVTIGDKTVISKTDTGSLSDLKTGDRVTVFSQQTGNSPTASFVQLQNGPGGFGN
jgi:hypothetical protein